jgi:hypothetical protein
MTQTLIHITPYSEHGRKLTQQHIHPTSYIKTEPTTRNIRNSYTQHKKKKKPKHQQHVSNIITKVIEQQYVI